MAVGFTGDSAERAPLAALHALQPGAILLFGRNVGDAAALPALVSALRALADPAPLIAIDQEGGRVARIRSGIVALPSAMALGAVGDAALVETLATALGRDLATFGITVDLAPCADLALHAANTVIGTRAFGERPHEAGRLAVAFARGLRRGGVAAAVKHFPGHGDTTVDSHRALPRVRTGAGPWRARDLVPFAAVLAGGDAALVMTAHVVLEALDPHRPATLSPAVLDVLRRELSFDGVVATDCLEMDAIAETVGTVEAAWRALAAGADLVLVSHRLDLASAAREAIVAAVERGALPAERLREAAARVDALRARYRTPAPYDGDLDPAAPAAAAARAVTAVRGAARLRDGAAVTVVSFEGGVADGINAVERAAAASLGLALRRRRVRADLLRVALEPAAGDVDLLLETLRLQPDREVVAVVRRAHLFPQQHAAVARILEAVPDALVVSAAEPYDALAWPAARRVMAIYGDDELAFEGLAEVLAGRAAAGGSLPVTIDEAAAVG